MSDEFLEVSFTDGTNTKLAIKSILKEFSNTNNAKFIEKVEWDSSLKDLNHFEFRDNIFEEKDMYKA